RPRNVDGQLVQSANRPSLSAGAAALAGSPARAGRSGNWDVAEHDGKHAAPPGSRDCRGTAGLGPLHPDRGRDPACERWYGNDELGPRDDVVGEHQDLWGVMA